MSPALPSRLSDTEVRRAAKELIRAHGDDALRKVAGEISALNSKGFYSQASTWKLIRQEISRLQYARYANKHLERVIRRAAHR